jgi:urea transport system substrate-binding protein
MLSKRARVMASTAAALAAALLLTSCSSSSKSASGSAAGSSGSSGSSKSKTCIDSSGSTIKLGLLNSLTGTMAISEVTVSNSLHMAVDEINKAGGIMGKKIDIVQEDGASDPTTFANKAKKLIEQDCVAAVFGGWTSSSRKAMLPVFEADDSILWYPVQYEGLESSHNIFYTGATTNQQILPALEWLKTTKNIKNLYLVGSDYVFPRTANSEIKAWAAANGVTITGEDYVPLSSDADPTTMVNKVKSAKPDAVFNTLNGDANVKFFKQLKAAGVTAAQTPVVSVSIGEEEVAGVGVTNLVGQYTAWNYYMTVNNAANTKFVAAYKAAYPKDGKTSDPMEASYTSMYLYKAAVEKAGSFDPEKVIAASGGISFAAPEGQVTINGDNHHIAKTFLMGQVNADGGIDVVSSSSAPIQPDPYLCADSWWKDTTGHCTGSSASPSASK